MADKIAIASKNQEMKTTTTIDIVQKDEKLLAIIKDVVDGQQLPVRYGYLNVVNGGETPFMVIDAPLREQDEQGNYKVRPREKDGQYLDARGKPVENAEQAAQEYVYRTSQADQKVVYGQVATLNVRNTKADKTPAKKTFISAKIYSDDEALQAARLLYKMKAMGEDHQDYAKTKEQLSALRSEKGTWSNFFINQGLDELAKMGFEVKIEEKSASMEP